MGLDELDSVSLKHQIGRRIHVVGNSCSGKSVLGKQLATALEVPFVEFPLAQRPKEIFAVAKMIIFDYGRTLYDRETDDFFPDAIPIVRTLAEKYRLSIVSVSSADEEETRIEALREKGILDHFEEIVFTENGDAKSKEYEALLRKVDLKANEVVVVDDYIIRGIAWGNAAGATTVWFRNGKFADLDPTDETGDPDFTIHSLSELLKILD